MGARWPTENTSASLHARDGAAAVSSRREMRPFIRSRRARATTLLAGVALSCTFTACNRELRRVAGTYAMEVHDDNFQGVELFEYDTLVLARNGTFLRRHVSVVNGEPHALDPDKGKVTVNGDVIHLVSEEGHVVLKRAANGNLNPEPNPAMMVSMMRDRELAKLWNEAKARGLIQPYVRVR